jgi:hypothetical protein
MTLPAGSPTAVAALHSAAVEAAAAVLSLLRLLLLLGARSPLAVAGEQTARCCCRTACAQGVLALCWASARETALAGLAETLAVHMSASAPRQRRGCCPGGAEGQEGVRSLCKRRGEGSPPHEPSGRSARASMPLASPVPPIALLGSVRSPPALYQSLCRSRSRPRPNPSPQLSPRNRPDEPGRVDARRGQGGAQRRHRRGGSGRRARGAAGCREAAHPQLRDRAQAGEGGPRGGRLRRATAAGRPIITRRPSPLGPWLQRQ